MAFVIWIRFSFSGLFSMCWNFLSARRGQNRMEGLWDQLGVGCGAFRTYYCRKPEKRSKTRLCGMDPDHFGFLFKLENSNPDVYRYQVHWQKSVGTLYLSSRRHQRCMFWCHFKGDFFVNIFCIVWCSQVLLSIFSGFFKSLLQRQEWDGDPTSDNPRSYDRYVFRAAVMWWIRIRKFFGSPGSWYVIICTDPDPFLYIFGGLDYMLTTPLLMSPILHVWEIRIRNQRSVNVVPVMGKKANSGPKLVIHVPYLYRTVLQIIVLKMTDFDLPDLDSYMHFTGLPHYLPILLF